MLSKRHFGEKNSNNSKLKHSAQKASSLSTRQQQGLHFQQNNNKQQHKTRQTFSFPTDTNKNTKTTTFIQHQTTTTIRTPLFPPNNANAKLNALIPTNQTTPTTKTKNLNRPKIKGKTAQEAPLFPARPPNQPQETGPKRPESPPWCLVLDLMPREMPATREQL